MTWSDNVEQHEAWTNESGLRWAADPDRRDRVLAPVAAVLQTAPGLRAGERVLDIGCGCGGADGTGRSLRMLNGL